MRRGARIFSAVDEPADFDQILLFVYDDIDVALANVFPLFQGQFRAALDPLRRLSVRHVRLQMNCVLISSGGSLLAGIILLALAERQFFLTRFP